MHPGDVAAVGGGHLFEADAGNRPARRHFAAGVADVHTELGEPRIRRCAGSGENVDAGVAGRCRHVSEVHVTAGDIVPADIGAWFCGIDHHRRTRPYPDDVQPADPDLVRTRDAHTVGAAALHRDIGDVELGVRPRG